MPENNPPTPPASSAFEIVTPSKSKKTNFKSILIILLVFVFLGGAIFLGVTLVKQNQNVAEKAACVQQCGVGPADLVNCDGADTNGAVSQCSFVRIESCGGQQYCCPAAGGSWTSDITICSTLLSTASPTATATASASPTGTPVSTIEPLVTQSPTPTATATSSSSSTATAKATATPKGASTPIPIPSTGTGWPTYLGAGVGIVVIIASILLAI